LVEKSCRSPSRCCRRWQSTHEERPFDDAFVSPWLLAAIVRNGKSIDARRVIVYHHKANEAVARLPSAFVVVPRQGESLDLN